MTAIQHPYEAYVQQASREEVMKTADWIYEAANGPRLNPLLTRLSDTQLLIFQAFASEWYVDEEFTLRMHAPEDRARVKLEIDRAEANYAAIRGVIKVEAQRRGIQQLLQASHSKEGHHS
ncbi:hypothetical protein [Pseudomonas mosselii]|uniref:hypothetical protein n=1 Tax=Pseudomonas mosselii TaxID=78327 RepID=UPI0021DA2A6B|nr:hypothetical protein [Pseudomonas mosselii]MCU9527556.1 hypothetical protein [Pseudomonas mosselii]MCU9534869.1 hypothetical protein [Pseudomonas mosselii]MCU9542372.1 hypothetical protein [Pseudomonas mosselii]MCU9546709.1 hypothetical protein [Pseudomonas mosselii]